MLRVNDKERQAQAPSPKLLENQKWLNPSESVAHSAKIPGRYSANLSLNKNESKVVTIYWSRSMAQVFAEDSIDNSLNLTVIYETHNYYQKTAIQTI